MGKFVAVGVLLYFLLPRDAGPAWSMLNMALLMILYAIGVFLHELGHVLLGLLGGLRIVEVSLGRGRTVRQLRVGRTRVQVHSLPFEGYVLAVPRAAGPEWWGQLLVAAGGPLMNLVLAAVPLLVAPNAVLSDARALGAGPAPLALWVAAHGILCVLSLVPVATLKVGDRSVSDGARIWWLVSDPHGALQGLAELSYVVDAEQALSEGKPTVALDSLRRAQELAPKSLSVLSCLADAYTEAGRFDEALLIRVKLRDALRATAEELASGEASPAILDIVAAARARTEAAVGLVHLLRGDGDGARAALAAARPWVPWEPEVRLTDAVLGLQRGILPSSDVIDELRSELKLPSAKRLLDPLTRQT